MKEDGLTLEQAQEILTSYTRGRPSKKVIQAREFMNEYNKKANEQYKEAEKIYKELDKDVINNLKEKKEEVKESYKQKKINKDDYRHLLDGLNDRIKEIKRLREETNIRIVPTLFIDAKFKDMYKTFKFEYEDKILSNTHVLFYNVIKDILYSKNSFVREFLKNEKKQDYIIQFKAMVNYLKPTQDAEAEVYVQTKPRKLTRGENRLINLKDMLFNELQTLIYEQETRDSGLMLTGVTTFYITLVKIRPMYICGGGEINICKKLLNKKITINLNLSYNDLYDSFYYAVGLSLLKQDGYNMNNIINHKERFNTMNNFKNLLDINDIKFNYDENKLYDNFNDYLYFENMNKNILLYVYEYIEEQDKIINIYNSNNINDDNINELDNYKKVYILRYLINNDEDKIYYLMITDILRMNIKNVKRENRILCPFCGRVINIKCFGEGASKKTYGFSFKKL